MAAHWTKFPLKWVLRVKSAPKDAKLLGEFFMCMASESSNNQHDGVSFSQKEQFTYLDQPPTHRFFNRTTFSSTWWWLYWWIWNTEHGLPLLTLTTNLKPNQSPSMTISFKNHGSSALNPSHATNAWLWLLNWIYPKLVPGLTWIWDRWSENPFQWVLIHLCHSSQGSLTNQCIQQLATCMPTF